MNVIVVGKGKLSNSLREGLKPRNIVFNWDEIEKAGTGKNIVIHAGSGRQKAECEAYCRESGSILLELSTGEDTDQSETDFPLIVCPNTAIPILKLLNMLSAHGKNFQDYNIRITESHQADKTTVAGTAVEIANSFRQSIKNIESIRDPEEQKTSLGIPVDFLSLHAYHKIIIEDEGCQMAIETLVQGHIAYVKGVDKIIDCLNSREWEKRKYHITELLQNGWL